MWFNAVGCIMTLTLSLLVMPRCSNAQQPGKVYRIGFVLQGSPPPSGASPNLDAFRHRLRELGWVEGTNLALEYRWAEGKYERLSDLAADLVGRQVDVLVAVGGPTAQAAKPHHSLKPRKRLGSDRVGAFRRKHSGFAGGRVPQIDHHAGR